MTATIHQIVVSARLSGFLRFPRRPAMPRSMSKTIFPAIRTE